MGIWEFVGVSLELELIHCVDCLRFFGCILTAPGWVHLIWPGCIAPFAPAWGVGHQKKKKNEDSGEPQSPGPKLGRRDLALKTLG